MNLPLMINRLQSKSCRTADKVPMAALIAGFGKINK